MTEATYLNWVPKTRCDLLEIEGVSNDILEARRFIKSAIDVSKESVDYQLIEPLTIAALIKYFRSFGGGKRLKRLSSSRLPPALEAAHKRLKAVRDWHYAHSINEFEVHSATISVKSLGTSDAEATGVSCSTTSNLGLSDGDSHNLILLCNHWLAVLQIERLKATEMLMAEANAMSAEQLNDLVSAPIVQPNNDPFAHR